MYTELFPEAKCNCIFFYFLFLYLDETLKEGNGVTKINSSTGFLTCSSTLNIILCFGNLGPYWAKGKKRCKLTGGIVHQTWKERTRGSH